MPRGVSGAHAGTEPMGPSLVAPSEADQMSVPEHRAIVSDSQAPLLRASGSKEQEDTVRPQHRYGLRPRVTPPNR